MAASSFPSKSMISAVEEGARLLHVIRKVRFIHYTRRSGKCTFLLYIPSLFESYTTITTMCEVSMKCSG